MQAVRRAFERNGLSCDPAIPFPLILQNGAVVYLPGESLFAISPFIEDEIDPLLAICQRHPRVSSVLFSPLAVEIMWPNAEAEKMIQRFDLDVHPFTSAGQAYTKITFISDSAEAINAVAEEIASFSVESYFSLPTVFELTRAGVDKGRMLGRLLAELGLQKETVAVAGDGQNDLPLFAVADRAFCPHGSPGVVRALAEAEIEVEANGILAPILDALGM